MTSGTYFVKVRGFGDATGNLQHYGRDVQLIQAAGVRPVQLIINGASTTSESGTTAEATANLSAILASQGHAQ